MSLFQAVFCQFVGDFLQVLFRLVAKLKDHVVGIPAIEMFGLTELGVAPQHDTAKAGPAAKADRPVAERCGAFLTGPVATAVLDEQHLACFGQGEQQWVITPGAVVGHVHALFALALGAD